MRQKHLNHRKLSTQLFREMLIDRYFFFFSFSQNTLACLSQLAALDMPVMLLELIFLILNIFYLVLKFDYAGVIL